MFNVGLPVHQQTDHLVSTLKAGQRQCSIPVCLNLKTTHYTLQTPSFINFSTPVLKHLKKHNCTPLYLRTEVKYAQMSKCYRQLIICKQAKHPSLCFNESHFNSSSSVYPMKAASYIFIKCKFLSTTQMGITRNIDIHTVQVLPHQVEWDCRNTH